MSETADHVDAFEAERPRLTALAYRMLGSTDEAEDAVQETWLRWSRTDQGAVERPAAWLTTVATRIALDRLGSARARREVYVGPWLPEPLLDGSEDPADAVAGRDTLTLSFLRVLETLQPVERAVFLLHDVFGIPFDEIGATVERTPEATRQIAVRARQRVRDGRPRLAADPMDAAALTGAFLHAVLDGDVDRLVTMLTDDVVLVSDGGAARHAARRPVHGADKVARLITNVTLRDIVATDEIHSVRANGQLATYVVREGSPYLLGLLGWRDERIAEVLVIVNPDKLQRFHQRWLASGR
jgi:RNA polymerase sigma-70 factor, ECF subfamily